MKWVESKVIFECDQMALAEELIANIFYELNLQGVVVEQPGLMPEEGWGDDAVAQPEHHAVSGFWPHNERMEERRRILETELARLAAAHQIRYHVACRPIDEEDWAESWKAYFRPEKITGHIVVKPTWRSYTATADDIVIELDPGMAFGTGTHPTTALCLQMLEDHLAAGKSFLDVGTGSGILMIAAAKLGASCVWGTDVDEVAVDIARRNLQQTAIDRRLYSVMRGELVKEIDRRFDLVAANILAGVVTQLLETLEPALAPGGIFICSGLIESQKAEVLQKMASTGFEPIHIRQKDDWVAIASRMCRAGED
jgi:ribosomal protein L11 methyltransferase